MTDKTKATNVDEDGGLVCAYLQTNGDAWTAVGWSEIRAWTPADGLLWVHLDRSGPLAQEYLRRESGVDSIVRDALLAEETRPREISLGDGLLLILRGVNLNPGQNPEDMVSLRLWLEAGRVISTRYRPLMAIQDMRERMVQGRGPMSSADFLVQIAAGLVDRMASVIAGLDEEEDALEDEIIAAQHREARTELARLRRVAIALRRYLAPQRDALARLQNEELTWLTAQHRARLREVTDRVIRYVEDLEAIRERAAVIQDELISRLSDQMNRNMYLLTIVATVMLPLGFITGLLGINVDGIPGADNAPWAFAAVCAALVALVAVEIWILRRNRWF